MLQAPAMPVTPPQSTASHNQNPLLDLMAQRHPTYAAMLQQSQAKGSQQSPGGALAGQLGGNMSANLPMQAGGFGLPGGGIAGGPSANMSATGGDVGLASGFGGGSGGMLGGGGGGILGLLKGLLV